MLNILKAITCPLDNDVPLKPLVTWTTYLLVGLTLHFKELELVAVGKFLID